MSLPIGWTAPPQKHINSYVKKVREGVISENAALKSLVTYTLALTNKNLRNPKIRANLAKDYRHKYFQTKKSHSYTKKLPSGRVITVRLSFKNKSR